MNVYLRPLYLTLVGVCKLSIPVIVMAIYYPTLMASFWGRVAAGITLGIYAAYRIYQSTIAHTKALAFEPTGTYFNTFQEMVTSCHLDPKNIRIRYCYTQESVALAFHDTVGIDPLVWNGMDQDESYKKALEVLTIHIVPTLTSEQKERLAVTQRLLTPTAQRFIFMHELGHIYHRYTYKKILITAVTTAAATYGTLTVCWMLFHAYHVPGELVIGIGIGIAAFTDLFLAFMSNVLFKVREEIKADTFAAQYSTPEEIRSAADFFEQLDIQVIKAIREPGFDPLCWLPQEARCGHLAGGKRAKFLRKLAEK